MCQLLAAWMIIHDKDYPLIQVTGVNRESGKTTLAYATAKELKREVYIFQATMDTRPEDLYITPVVSSQQEINMLPVP
jgi:Holliday junction resolvasome RuvABC ATP-dependent DNA helicase subunit